MVEEFEKRLEAPKEDKGTPDKAPDVDTLFDDADAASEAAVEEAEYLERKMKLVRMLGTTTNPEETLDWFLDNYEKLKEFPSEKRAFTDVAKDFVAVFAVRRGVPGYQFNEDPVEAIRMIKETLDAIEGEEKDDYVQIILASVATMKEVVNDSNYKERKKELVQKLSSSTNPEETLDWFLAPSKSKELPVVKRAFTDVAEAFVTDFAVRRGVPGYQFHEDPVEAVRMIRDTLNAIEGEEKDDYIQIILASFRSLV